MKSGIAFLGEGASSSADKLDKLNASIGLMGIDDTVDAVCALWDADNDDIALEQVPG